MADNASTIIPNEGKEGRKCKWMMIAKDEPDQEHIVRSRMWSEKTDTNDANTEDDDDNDELKQDICNKPQLQGLSIQRQNKCDDM